MITKEKLELAPKEPKWRSERIRKALLRHFKRFYMTNFGNYVKDKTNKAKLHSSTFSLIHLAKQYVQEKDFCAQTGISIDYLAVALLLLAH